MKKLLIVLSLFIMTCVIQAQETEIVTDVIATVEQTVEQTTSFGREVYNDAKEAIAQLGEALGVASEYVFEILVRQQYVEAFIWLMSLPFIIITILLFRWALLKGSKDNWNSEFSIIITVFAGFLVFGAIIWFFAMMRMGATGLFNPEYGALHDVIDMIHKL